MDDEDTEVNKDIKKQIIFISVKNKNLDSLVKEVKILENKFISTTDIFITRSRTEKILITVLIISKIFRTKVA